MTKYIITAIATLALTSCEGLNVSFQDEHLGTSYSSKGGLVVTPKIPTAITIIEPAK